MTTPTFTACKGTDLGNGRSVHSQGGCPKWCQAAWWGAPFGAPKPVPTTAQGAFTFADDQVSRGVDGTYVVRRLHTTGGAGRPITQPEWRENAEYGITALLRLMGEDPTRPGLRDTPARVVKAYLELADRPGDPASLLGKVFADVTAPEGEMIAVPGIHFTSLCEHHLLPFTGTCTVAYIPNGGGVVGLSKIPRLVQHHARRPQVQERLTGQIVDDLVTHLDPAGAAVLIESEHSCMALRGVRAQGATMVTSALRGRFLENPATRAEFMALATRGTR
jgi:GTP cyclohydrolase I